MLRYLALTLLVGCSASAGGASFEGGLPEEAPVVAGAAGSASAGAPSGDVPTGGLASGGGGGSAGSPVAAKGGREPDPTAGAPTVAGQGGGGGGVGGSSAVVSAGAAAGGSSAGAAGTAGAPSAGSSSSGACPADFYCHELGADAFATCMLQDLPDDPQFPGCTIQRGTCFYPATAPESCIKAECWSKKRTCG